MTEHDDTTQVMTDPQGPEPRRKRLLRSRSDRMLGGVAGGLAEYFRVDPVIFRIGFAVTVFFGGLGVLTYLALLIFVPAEAETPGPPEPRSASRIMLTIAAVFIGAISLAVIAAASFYVAAVGHGVAVAIVVIVAGALIALGVTKGRRWLILPALAVAFPLGAVAVADVNVEGGIGEREYTPTSYEAIPDEGYRLGIGDMRIDLRELPWREGDVVDLRASQGMGRIAVAVPEDVCVTGEADVQGGDIDVAGTQTDGWGAETSPNAGSEGTPQLVLDADLDFGQVLVVNSDDADLDEHRFQLGDDRRADFRAAMEAACAPDPAIGRADAKD